MNEEGSMMQLQSAYALISSCDCEANLKWKEEESRSERRRETSMFTCGEDSFTVDRLTDGCWHSCV